MAIDGRFIGVVVDGEFISCETSSTLTIENETLEIASKGRKGFRDYIYGYKGWSLNVTGVMANSTSSASWHNILTKIINTNDEFEVFWRTRDGYGEEMLWKGQALVSNWTGDASIEGKAMQSITFQGCGEPEFWAEAVWRRINAMPAPADKDTIVDAR